MTTSSNGSGLTATALISCSRVSMMRHARSISRRAAYSAMTGSAAASHCTRRSTDARSAAPSWRSASFSHSDVIQVYSAKTICQGKHGGAYRGLAARQ